MKSKKEHLLLKLEKKFYKWDFKLNFLLLGTNPYGVLSQHPLLGQTSTSKGACSKQFYAPLGINPLVQQTHMKKIVVPCYATRICLLPLAADETTPVPDKVWLWSKMGKGNEPGADKKNTLWAYHRYEPLQKKHFVTLFMLRMHLKQLKTFMLPTVSIKNVFPTVVLPYVVPTYSLNPSLAGCASALPERDLLPFHQISWQGTRYSHMLTGSSMGSGSVMGIRGKDNLTYGSLRGGFAQKEKEVVLTTTCPATLIPLCILHTSGTKLLWGKTTSSQGSRVNKASLPKVRSNKKKNSLKGEKVAYTQEDLIKKTSRFINIWCYLQMLFFSSHILKQPMVARAYPNVGYRPVNFLTSTKDSLKGCFFIWVKKFDCYPWLLMRQPERVFVPTKMLKMLPDYNIAWVPSVPVKGVKVEVLALSFLPQLKLGYLKGWLLYLEERVSKTSLSRVKEASLSSSISKKKGSVSIFRKLKMPSLQTNPFYKYLGFCDYIVLKLMWKWCSRKHSNQSAQWIRCHYFYKLNGQNWVFALKKILFNPTTLATGRLNLTLPYLTRYRR